MSHSWDKNNNNLINRAKWHQVNNNVYYFIVIESNDLSNIYLNMDTLHNTQ